MASLLKGTCSPLLRFLYCLRLTQDHHVILTATRGSMIPTHSSFHPCRRLTWYLSTARAKTSMPNKPVASCMRLQEHMNSQLKFLNQRQDCTILLNGLATIPKTITEYRHLHYYCVQRVSSLSRNGASSFHETGQSRSMEMDNSTIRRLAQELLVKTAETDVMAGSIPQSKVERLAEELQILGFDEEIIKTSLTGKLWLLQQTEATLTLCRLLLDHGSTARLVCRVLDCIPQENQRDIGVLPDKVNEVLTFFRSFGFSEKEMFSMLDRDAFVLFTDLSSTKNSIEMVKSYFPSALTKKVICASPNVLHDDWSLTHDKFNYCVFMMGYNQSDIVKSRLFSHSLHHIKDRHLFLQRAGVFQVVNKKLHPSLNINPPLSSVVDSNIASFVKLVGGGVSAEEYRVFQKMREIERENAGLDDDNDNDDDHTDDDRENPDIDSELEEEKK